MAEEYQTQWQPTDDPGFTEEQDFGSPRKPKATMAQGLVGGARNKLFALADDGKSELARSIDGIVVMVRELADKADIVGGPVASYARQAADAIGDIQQTIRDKPVEELIEEGREMVRSSPGLAIGIAVAAGFLGARLVKAGSR